MLCTKHRAKLLTEFSFTLTITLQAGTAAPVSQRRTEAERASLAEGQGAGKQRPQNSVQVDLPPQPCPRAGLCFHLPPDASGLILCFF